MICRKCGCILDKGTKICPFCEEPAEPGTEDLMTRVVGDDGSGVIRSGIPPLVKLNELAAVPAEQTQLLDELHRLHTYFEQIKGKYGVLGDLWLMQSQYQEPSLGHWIWGGGFLTLLVYLLLSGLDTGLVWTFFFVLWLVITTAGYVRSGKRYERDKAKIDADIRGVENEVRDWYNQAECCFLPLDYSDPQVIRELIDGIRSGVIKSFQDYRPVS